VLRQAADELTAAIMELSGVDAVVALPGTNWERIVKAIEFGLMFNSGATCIGPRRLMFDARDGKAQNAFRVVLVGRLKALHPVVIHPAARESVAAAVEQAVANGATDLIGKFNAEVLRRDGLMHPVVLSGVVISEAGENAPILQTDLFAPVISLLPLTKMKSAIELVNGCPYRLAASVFGPRRQAEAFATQLRVGCVTINDLVAPTADPRLPFGGRGDSGFGVTRGPEGLLAMTTPRVIAIRKGRVAPHLSTRKDSDAELLTGVLQSKHARTLRQRVAALSRVVKAGRNR
jgi:aldehyde dehydrogenase (NAD+)